MRTVVFRIRGPFGHFRKVYTTTSANTYSFPPRTAILGLIGAILGIENRPLSNHIKELGNLKVSAALEKPIRKTTISVNYLHTKERKRTQIPLEVLRDPSFLIFVSEENFEKFDTFCEMIKQGESVFTPYLGISEFIAKIEFVGVFETSLCHLPCEVHSVVSSTQVKVKPEKGILYLKERAVRQMDEFRNYKEHSTYILSATGKPLKIVEGEVYSVGRWNIAWM